MRPIPSGTRGWWGSPNRGSNHQPVNHSIPVPSTPHRSVNPASHQRRLTTDNVFIQLAGIAAETEVGSHRQIVSPRWLCVNHATPMSCACEWTRASMANGQPVILWVCVCLMYRRTPLLTSSQTGRLLSRIRQCTPHLQTRRGFDCASIVRRSKLESTRVCLFVWRGEWVCGWTGENTVSLWLPPSQAVRSQVNWSTVEKLDRLRAVSLSLLWIHRLMSDTPPYMV